MPQNFLSCDRDQPLLLPPDLHDWLPEDHLAWFVIDAVSELDLEPFYASYRAAGHGAAEDEIHGTVRGDELPEGLRTANGRRAWLREAKEELERERAENPEPVRRERAARLETCRRRLAEDWRAERRANQRYEAYRARGVMKNRRRFGAPPKPYSPPAAPDGKLNTTDPDARRMKFGRNFMPAYNAQAVTTENQVIVAAEITINGGDFEQLDPMISAAERELETAGVEESPGVVLADAGYWSNDHIDSLRGRGIVPIVAADTTRNRPRKTRLGGPYDFMRRVIATEVGAGLYAKRQCMVEPIFAQIK